MEAHTNAYHHQINCHAPYGADKGAHLMCKFSLPGNQPALGRRGCSPATARTQAPKAIVDASLVSPLLTLSRVLISSFVCTVSLVRTVTIHFEFLTALPVGPFIVVQQFYKTVSFSLLTNTCFCCQKDSTFGHVPVESQPSLKSWPYHMARRGTPNCNLVSFPCYKP